MSDVLQIFARRLGQARKIARLSFRELSEALGGVPSHTMLSRYEKGETMPDGAVLARLVEVLKQPADFFFRSYEVEFSGLSFRRKSSLGVGSRQAIQEKARDFFSRYLELEELLNARVSYAPPFAGEEMPREEDVERVALELRSKWNLGTDPIPNLQQFIELKGIKVHEVETDDPAFDGFSCEANGEPIIVVASWLGRNVPRKRMTLAHELGHVVLPIPESLSEADQEKLVKPFASAFLMPEEHFKSMFGGRRSGISLGELLELKTYFGVSMMAIMYRASRLDLISQAVCQRFFMQAGLRGWRKREVGEPGDERFEDSESHGRMRQMVLQCVTEGVVSSSRGAALLGVPLEQFRQIFKESFT